MTLHDGEGRPTPPRHIVVASDLGLGARNAVWRAAQLAGVPADHIVGELGEVLLGRAPGRVDAAQLTLFKSLGLAVEDVVAARHVVERAREASAGTLVSLA